jgi:hypothetical protein
MTHDTLCPINQYLGFPDPLGLANAATCRCELIARVREDQTKILNSRVMYQSGYTDGYAHGYEMALDHAIACFEEDDAYTAIQALRDI